MAVPVGPHTHTGIFATAEEIERILALRRELDSTPVIKVAGQWLPGIAEDQLMRAIDELAIAHGLPRPGQVDGETDHYGMLLTGEFVGRPGQVFANLANEA